MFGKTLLTAATAATLLATTASATTMASAVTDLNLRAGPGPNYRVLDVIPAQGAVEVDGCLADSNWCQVTHNGMAGWAYGDYLGAEANGEVVALYPNREVVEVQTVTYDNQGNDDDALALGATGAMIGALAVGGPAAAIVGGVLGTAVGATLPETDIAYIQSNPVEPVFVRGEVVRGATVPQEVAVYEVPGGSYVYTNLNGRYVVLDQGSREIVYIGNF